MAPELGTDEAIVERLHAIEDRLESLTARLEEVARAVTAAARHTHRDGALATEIERIAAVVDSLLRRELLAGIPLPPHRRLAVERASLYSQNGEDGMLLGILAHAGAETRTFAELGCGHNGGNSGVLARELGWSGLMVDGDKRAVSIAGQLFAGPGVEVQSGWIDRESAPRMLAKHGLDEHLDVLSIDIDGMDWWIWESLRRVPARIVIVEYNAHLGNERAVTVPYDAAFQRPPVQRWYYGASLLAFDRLATRLGYRLVAVEPRGVNAFFVRSDVAPELPAVSPDEAWRPQTKVLPLLTRPLKSNVKAELDGELPLIDVDDLPELADEG